MDVVEVTILGRVHALRLPDHATRQELVEALASPALLRVCAAYVGLCTRVGQEAAAEVRGLSYVACGCSVLEYGGRLYGYLVERGVSIEEIDAAGAVLIRAVTLSRLPVEAAKAKAGFSGPAAG